MDPDAPWQGSPEAAPGKAVEAEHEAASRSYVRREGDDARGGRVRDAIIEVARATESGPRARMRARPSRPHPRLRRTRKRGFRVLNGCTAVQGRSSGLTGMHKTDARRFLNGEEPANNFKSLAFVDGH